MKHKGMFPKKDNKKEDDDKGELNKSTNDNFYNLSWIEKAPINKNFALGINYFPLRVKSVDKSFEFGKPLEETKRYNDKRENRMEQTYSYKKSAVQNSFSSSVFQVGNVRLKDLISKPKKGKFHLHNHFSYKN